MLKSSDTRVVNSDFNTVVSQLEQYLDNRNFEITNKTLQKSECYIVAKNKHRSFFKLFWTARPQITYWHIYDNINNGIRVKANIASFRLFQGYFYGILLFLLTLTGLFSQVATYLNTGDSFSHFQIYFIFLALFIFTCGFFLWLIRTKPYSQFFDGYYLALQKITFKKEQAIELHPGFPEIIPGFMIFMIYMIFILIILCNMHNFEAMGYMLLGALAFAVLAITLLITILFCAEKTVRTIFLLMAIYLCVPLAVYSNLPMIGLSSKKVFNIINQLVRKNKLLDEKIKANPAFAKKLAPQIKELKDSMYKFSVVLCILYTIICIVLIFLLASTFYLPVEILRRIERFNTNNKDSLYFKAMTPESIINPFNACIIGIWLLLGIANLSGLFFSLAVLGKTVGMDNFIIKSGISDLFFDSSRMMFDYLLHDSPATQYVHSFFMLLYAIPMPLLFAQVVVKNTKLTLKTTLSLKYKLYEEPLGEAAAKIKAICKDCKIRPPIIKIASSEEINEGASYLGFPVFQNVLVIPKRTIEMLGKTDYVLDAYLAHEIYHLKKHTFVWKILCLLSDFTLFGNGFLTILHSSYELELSADAYAMGWLKRHNIPPAVLITALQTQEELKEQELFGMLLNNLNFAKSVENEEYRQAIIKQCDNSGRLKKALINLKLLYQMYFGEYITSYIHPSNEYRIELIEENISETV